MKFFASLVLLCSAVAAHSFELEWTDITPTEVVSFNQHKSNLLISIAEEVSTLEEDIRFIRKRFPFHRPISVYHSTVENLSLFAHGDGYVIAINQHFVDTHTSNGTRWTARGWLAHEIGHIINADLHHDGDRRQEELNADHFAGRILQAFGATAQQATEAWDQLPEVAVAPYPSKSDRLANVAAGWASGCEVDPSCEPDLGKETDLLNEDPFSAIYDFRFNGWSTMFHASILNFAQEGESIGKDAKLLLVLRNESLSDLSKVVLSHHDFSGLRDLSVYAWKIDGEQWPSAFDVIQPYREFQNQTADDKALALSKLIKEVKQIDGGLLDEAQFRWTDDGKVETVIEGEGAIRYFANKDTVRIPNLRERIKRYESIIILIEFSALNFSIDEVSGKPDSLGHLTPFPARVSLLNVNFESFDEVPYIKGRQRQRVDVGNGAYDSTYFDSSFSVSESSLVADHNFLPQHARQEVKWRWQ